MKFTTSIVIAALAAVTLAMPGGYGSGGDSGYGSGGDSGYGSGGNGGSGNDGSGNGGSGNGGSGNGGSGSGSGSGSSSCPSGQQQVCCTGLLGDLLCELGLTGLTCSGNAFCCDSSDSAPGSLIDVDALNCVAL